VASRACKYRLYPTRKQERLLLWVLARCRELYNAALSEWKDAYQQYERMQLRVNPETGQVIAVQKIAGHRVRSVSYYEQKRDLVEIKDLREEYRDIHSQVLQDVLLRLKRAFDGFFRRIENGETPGYPRFQGRNRYNSFTYPQDGYSLTDDGRVSLSKIGSVKITMHRPLEGTVKTATIKYEAGQWYIVFSCEATQPEPLPPVESEVGIDLGVTHFAALSDGTFIESPRLLRKAQTTLKYRQRHLSRCKRGSHRREKVRRVVARAHRKVRNQRRDFQHKAAIALIKQQQVIVLEDLHLANLVRRAKPKKDETTGEYLPNGAAAKSGLSKSLLDNGLGQFVQIITRKAAYAGREVYKVNPSKTSQICSQCGKQGPHKDLSERVHICVFCGVVLDRDVNAAINIYLAWKRPTVWASMCGVGVRAVEASRF
jgi:putative transposase